MKISVFCSASQELVAEYASLTEQLGQWLAAEGHTLVYGGVSNGLMECLAKTVHEAGGLTIGVIPQTVVRSGRLSQYVDVEILCDNLSDRKELMLEKSDIAIALPGGIGTIDEVFTMSASATIGFHQKHVVLYNMNGFWDGLIRMLDDLQEKGAVRGSWRDHIQVANSLEELATLVQAES